MLGAAVFVISGFPAKASVVLDFDSYVFANANRNNSIGTTVMEDGFNISAPSALWVFGTGVDMYSGDSAIYNSAPSTNITVAADDNGLFDLESFTVSEGYSNNVPIVIFTATYADLSTSNAIVVLDGVLPVPQIFTAGVDYDATAFSKVVSVAFYQVVNGFQINSIVVSGVPEPRVVLIVCSAFGLLGLRRR